MVRDVLVIGGGAAGLCAAHRLSEAGVGLALIEASPSLGGHAHTFVNGRQSIDTAFQIYNNSRYPVFTRLLDRLGLSAETAPACMSVGVHAPSRNLDYTLFHSPTADILNLLRMGPLRAIEMLRHFLAFRARLPFIRHHVLSVPDATVADLTGLGVSPEVVRDLVSPLVSVIWSQDEALVASLPLGTVLRFFDNHHLLTTEMGDGTWRSFRNGCQVYVKRLADTVRGDVVSDDAVVVLEKRDDDIWVARLRSGQVWTARSLILATPAWISAELMSSVCPCRAALLNRSRRTRVFANAYVRSSKQLSNALPRSFAASWIIDDQPDTGRQLYYNLRTLRRAHPGAIATDGAPFLHLSANAQAKAPAVLGDRLYQCPYAHIVLGSLQDDHLAILRDAQGHQNLYLCGSYFGAGFHEDAVSSGFQAAEVLLERS